MRDVNTAQAEISAIRAKLLATTRFRGISPRFNTILGMLVLVVTALQTLRAPVSGVVDGAFILVWASVLGGCTAVTAVEAVARSRRLHGGMSRAMLLAVLGKVGPFTAVALALGHVVWLFAPDMLWLLPGLWLTLVGLLGISLLANVPRELVWVAFWYLLCGGVLLYRGGLTGTLAPWMVGIPLATGQLAVAYILNKSEEDDDG